MDRKLSRTLEHWSCCKRDGDPCQDQFEHHVIGEQNVGRVVTDFHPLFFLFLPGVLPVADWKLLACALLVVCLELLELLKLGVDQGVHGVNDDRPDALRLRVLQEVLEYAGDIGERFA